MTSPAPSLEGEQKLPTQRQSGSRLHHVRDAEIAHQLDCAAITVRRHLRTLRLRGDVQVAGTRPRYNDEGKLLDGRRTNEYRLAAQPGTPRQ